MPIDWFTVGAQAVNFIVLVWILKRFLYRPVLKAMDERQKRVEETMLEATREKDAAAAEKAAFEQKNRNLEQEREAVLDSAAREAEAERVRLTEQARGQVQSLREQWRENLRHEQDDLKGEVAARVQHEVLAIAGQLVRDLADTDLQECFARMFIRKLGEMPPAERESLAPPSGGGSTDGGEAVLCSSGTLNDDLRGELERAARTVIGEHIPLRFETNPSLGGGIELAVNGRKTIWTVDHYLDSLETGLRELIEQRDKTP